MAYDPPIENYIDQVLGGLWSGVRDVFGTPTDWLSDTIDDLLGGGM